MLPADFVTVDRISVSVGDSSLVYGDWGGVNDPGSISRSLSESPPWSSDINIVGKCAVSKISLEML